MKREVVTLADVFDPMFKDVKFDTKYAAKLYRWQIQFLNKSQEYMAFFGSNLIGVHVVQWRTSDSVNFTQELTEVEFPYLESEVKRVTTVDHDYVIQFDPLNLLFMYIAHRCLTSPYLSKTDRTRAAYDAILVFFYRALVLRQSEWFHFPADPKIAQAAYGELSKKFLIKKLGSWKALMEYRAKEMLNPSLGHYQDIVDFKDDVRIGYAIGDGENRIREMYKIYYGVLDNMVKRGEKIQTSSSTFIDPDGVETLKDKVKHTEQAVNTLRQMIIDAPSFLNYELASIVLDINQNTSQRMLIGTLTWLSDNYNKPTHHAKIDEYITLITVHSYHLLRESKHINSRDYATVLIDLKNLYLSTRSTDKDLLRIRVLGDQLIKAANGSINKSLAMATRTATILYITMRTLISEAKH